MAYGHETAAQLKRGVIAPRLDWTVQSSRECPQEAQVRCLTPAPWVIAADARPGLCARARARSGSTAASCGSSRVKARPVAVCEDPPRRLVDLHPHARAAGVGSFVFGSVMKVPSGGVPYFVFFLVGQIPWNCFDGPLIRGSRGLEVNRELLTKLYVPRIILPLGADDRRHRRAGDHRARPRRRARVLPRRPTASGTCRRVRGCSACVASVALVLAFAFSLSLWTSVWQARARDARFVAPLRRRRSGCIFTPVIYPLSIVPAEYPLADVSQSADGAGRDVQVGDAAAAGAFLGLVRVLGGGDAGDVLLAASGISRASESATMDKM